MAFHIFNSVWSIQARYRECVTRMTESQFMWLVRIENYFESYWPFSWTSPHQFICLPACLPASWQVSSASLFSCDIRNRFATFGFSFQASNKFSGNRLKLDTFGAQQRTRVRQQIPFPCRSDEEGSSAVSGVGLGSEILVLVTTCWVVCWSCDVLSENCWVVMMVLAKYL